MVQPNGPIFKVADKKGKVGGCFCWLPALNEKHCFNTVLKIVYLTIAIIKKNQKICREITEIIIVPWHGISNNVVCATSRLNIP